MSGDHECHVCATVKSANDDNTVFRDADWTVTSAADAPGMVMLSANVHDDGLRSITPSAAASMGRHVVALSAALLDGGPADRVALIHMGDNAVHTHFLLVAREGPTPPIADTGPLMERVKATRDPAAAKAMVRRIRDAVATA